MKLNIQHDPQQQLFFALIDGSKAILQYKPGRQEKTLDYYHTFVPEVLRGRKIGDDLVKFALDYARANHYKVIPSCPFVARIIERAPEYKDLVVNS